MRKNKKRRAKYQTQIDKLYDLLKDRELEIRSYLVDYVNNNRRSSVSGETLIYSLLGMLKKSELEEIYPEIDEINKGEFIDEICKYLFDRISLKRRLITYQIIKCVREIFVNKCGVYYYSVPGNSFKFVLTDMDFERLTNKQRKDLITRTIRSGNIYNNAIKLYPQLASGKKVEQITEPFMGKYIKQLTGGK